MAPFILFIVAFVLETGSVWGSVPVSLTTTGPAVRGSNVTFTATILTGYSANELKFVFCDDADPQNSIEIISTNRSVNYTVEYNRDKYEAGQYKITLDLKKRIFFEMWTSIGGNETAFSLTDSLHGNLILKQNETERPNSYVAVNKSVNHFVRIPDRELEFLKQNSSSIVTYWFIDCVFIDQTTDFALNYTYPDVMSSHDVEAVVVADNKPLPPITTTTTTTTTTTPKPTTTTTKPTTTTAKPTTTTPKPTTTAEPTTLPPTNATTVSTTTANIVTEDTPVHKVAKRAISNRTIKKGVTGMEGFKCNHSIPLGEGYTYGRYHQTIQVREPISTINITGMNWLQHGDLLNLAVKYTGSPPFQYCVQYKLGLYNITGNESCSTNANTVKNDFQLVHYFSDSEQHTVVVVIGNDIGRTVSKATINIYKAHVHAQLSVIVVPVFFCLVAVILVVFGIAYYQHRTRHTVEVADFDFGQAHLDYKTFRERLRDSFRNAFNFRQRDDTESLTTNTRYDSMT